MRISKKKIPRPIQYSLQIVQKTQNKELFVVHNDELVEWEPNLIKEYLYRMLDHYYEGSPMMDDGNPLFGMLYDLKKFKGIKWLETEFKENQIQTDIKQADRYLLGNLFKKVNRIKTDGLEEYEFREEKNTLCVIQDIGNINIISKTTRFERHV